MAESNPIFKKHYSDYLQRFVNADLSVCATVPGITVDEATRSVRIPFFTKKYHISAAGILDERGERPDYGVCVVLLKYILMCPRQIPERKDWITYREFKDSGQSQDAGLADYASKMISKHYSGNLERLRKAVAACGGKPPAESFPYDISAVLHVLPRIPMLFLFNDADDLFPAQTSILYERRAEHLLDAECRIMADWYLLEELKKGEASLYEL